VLCGATVENLPYQFADRHDNSRRRSEHRRVQPAHFAELLCGARDLDDTVGGGFEFRFPFLDEPVDPTVFALLFLARGA
jgi:hypothetical protein